MSESGTTLKNLDLAALAERLALEGMPPQTVIAREAGVSQSTVSRALHGKIRTNSIGAQSLWDYATARVQVLESTDQQNEARHAAIEIPRQTRASRIPRRRRTGPNSDYDWDRLAREALAGLQDYLNDAFDPALVIEQLAVLRRAQDRGR